MYCKYTFVEIHYSIPEYNLFNIRASTKFKVILMKVKGLGGSFENGCRKKGTKNVSVLKTQRIY